MKRRGFTIVELIITIAIMGILMTLAVVNLNASQIKARDDERASDVQAIALALENFYVSGTDTFTSVSRYPTTAITTDYDTTKSFLRDIDDKSLMAPGVTNTTDTFTPATNNIQTEAGVLPQPTTAQYVYQPIMTTGALCTTGNTDCRKFNLYYRSEADNAVHRITSKNQ